MFKWEDHRPRDAEAVDWDVVIVGTGMGGAFLGWSLARQGASVLFLERGEPASPFNQPSRGGLLKRLLGPDTVEADLALGGRWNRRVSLVHGGRRREFHLPLGSGPGGSSAIYGAALERFRREDFAGTDGQGIVPPPLANRWPISYDSFLPYYRQAEQILGVRGERDPADPDDDSDLRPPPPMSACDAQFFEIFRQAGLAPHRLHVGIDYKPGCAECLGRLCPRDCKAESANRALWPALQCHGAQMVTGFAVERLGMSGARVTHVVGRRDGVEMTIRGRIVVLAAGAFNTPVILLKSATQDWPTGVGNRKGLVGAGLMFHVLQVFALWKSGDLSAAGPSKTISCRVMNEVDGDRLGGFQSFAQRVAPGQISEFLLSMVERRLAFRAPVIKLFTYAAALVGARLFRDAALFAAHTEDFAYAENRVTADANSPSGFQIAYRGTKELSARSARFRRFIRARLPGRRVAWLSAPGQLNFGHPCGTCRFGESPDTSVLDPQNKVWGTTNLYVVDASFFPSSAATNPGLTVAANALRVAAVIAENRRGADERVASAPRDGAHVT